VIALGPRCVLVQITVEVRPEPSNETDPWTPPSTAQVAEYLDGLHGDTDQGWYISCLAEATRPGVPTMPIQ
jgi:hypothetical protein